jgi:uncharacterized protein (DUF983 family)
VVLFPTVCVVGLTTVGLLLYTPERTSNPVVQLLTVFVWFELALLAALRLVR